MENISVIKGLYSLFTLSFYDSKSFSQYFIFRDIFTFVCEIFKHRIITISSVFVIPAVNIVGGSYISIFLVLINININLMYRSLYGTFIPLWLEPRHFYKPPVFPCGSISRRSFTAKITFILIFFGFFEDSLLIFPMPLFYTICFL